MNSECPLVNSGSAAQIGYDSFAFVYQFQCLRAGERLVRRVISLVAKTLHRHEMTTEILNIRGEQLHLL